MKKRNPATAAVSRLLGRRRVDRCRGDAVSPGSSQRRVFHYPVFLRGGGVRPGPVLRGALRFQGAVDSVAYPGLHGPLAGISQPDAIQSTATVVLAAGRGGDQIVGNQRLSGRQRRGSGDL